MTTRPEVRPGNYAAQAQTYDLTRGASPTVVRLVGAYLGPSRGRRLADVAGGTGNYAQVLRARGFDVVIVDAEVAMLAGSVQKVGPGRQVVGDARALPLGDSSVDCMTLISALHLFPVPDLVFAEARRVIRGGPYVLEVFTAENLRHAFFFDYFPGSAPSPDMHPPAEEIERRLHAAGFSRVERSVFAYQDRDDANLHVMHTDPELLADPAHLRNVSAYQRLPEDLRREGLARITEDLHSGVLAEKVTASLEEAARTGHATVFGAWP
jgi:SAM-dependent methyltransferase